MLSIEDLALLEANRETGSLSRAGAHLGADVLRGQLAMTLMFRPLALAT
ncbi:hypothetical protein [Pseudomonas sp. ANT_H12B]|nr:hypothetical protein [Pseudomonas sp. ANT_H12B]